MPNVGAPFRMGIQRSRHGSAQGQESPITPGSAVVFKDA